MLLITIASVFLLAASVSADSILTFKFSINEYAELKRVGLVTSVIILTDSAGTNSKSFFVQGTTMKKGEVREINDFVSVNMNLLADSVADLICEAVRSLSGSCCDSSELDFIQLDGKTCYLSDHNGHVSEWRKGLANSSAKRVQDLCKKLRVFLSVKGKKTDRARENVLAECRLIISEYGEVIPRDCSPQ